MLGGLFNTKKKAGAIPVASGSVPEDSTAFLPADQEIVHQGFIWKLNAGENPASSKSWVQRQMFLMSSGTLFYYSPTQSKPFGRSIRGLCTKPAQYMKNHFAFELKVPGVGGATMSPTVLATESANEREVWMMHLQKFESCADGDSDDLNPLEAFGTRLSARRASNGTDERLMTCRMETFKPEKPGRITKGAGGGATWVVQPSVNDSSWSFTHKVSTPESGFAAGIAEHPEVGGKPPVAVRRNSQAGFSDRTSTVLILDWDDTIFPSTWVRDDCGLNWRVPFDAQVTEGPRKTLIKNLLARLLERMHIFFRTANTRACILIVTLAKRPWVDISAKNFLPELGTILSTYNIKVIYAQEFVSEAMSLEYSKDEFKTPEQIANFWTRVKQDAITNTLDEFHETSGGASWKNLISLGDSDFERFGTIAASEDYMKRSMDGGCMSMAGSTAEGVSKDGHFKRLRTKTVKMLSEPTVEELTAELALLEKWIPYMVEQDGGFDLEIESTNNDDKLMELNKRVTGKDEILSWEGLAGMTTAAHKSNATE